MCVRKDGTIDWRMRSCWCLGCMSSLYDGTLGWGKTHIVKDCVAIGMISDGDQTDGNNNLNGNMYMFEEMDCSKTAGPGVSAVVQKSTQDRNTMASKLVVGDFVLFDAHDDDVEPIWLGRVMSYPSWNGHGVHVNDTQKNVKFNGVSIG